MGQIRHGSATITYAVRAAIQRSQASLSQLSAELGINPKTVAKWRKCATVEDLKTEPKEPRSTVLMEAEEALTKPVSSHATRGQSRSQDRVGVHRTWGLMPEGAE